MLGRALRSSRAPRAERSLVNGYEKVAIAGGIAVCVGVLALFVITSRPAQWLPVLVVVAGFALVLAGLVGDLALHASTA